MHSKLHNEIWRLGRLKNCPIFRILIVNRFSVCITQNLLQMLTVRNILDVARSILHGPKNPTSNSNKNLLWYDLITIKYYCFKFHWIAFFGPRLKIRVEIIRVWD